MSRYELLESTISEAQRQLTVCNACRYCEGYCSVFPSLHQMRQIADDDVIQLANLCHNCRACHYACQFSEPHEYNIKLPQALAEVRVESYSAFSRPQVFSRLFQRHGVAISLLLIALFIFLFTLVNHLDEPGGEGFYAFMSHSLMVLIFTPAFILPLFVITLGLRDYWKATSGKKVKFAHMKGAFMAAYSMKNLGGGQGQGCNFEDQDRFSNARRYFHQAAAFGFLLCFASTSVGTLMHYVLDMPAPYAWYSLPKLFGVTGGLGLVIGCAGLAWLKTNADPELGAQNVWGAEMAFIFLLGATGLTGLILYALTGLPVVKEALVIHLACVLTLFLLLPYSKMVHGFYRLAALIRDEQSKES